tara:strand:+ start:460 stop:1173 length:714 start_codon:yes stop_codon:yes gene_type:complete
MNGKRLISLVQAAERGFSKRQASEMCDIPYRTVLQYAKQYELKFACGRRMANERIRKEKLERERNGGDHAEPQVNGSLHLSSKELEPDRLEAAVRGIEGTTPNSRASLDRWYKLLMAQAQSASERRELVWAYKMFAYEIDMIRNKERPPFPTRQRYIDEESLSWAKRESNNRRDRIIQAFNGKSRTASEISEHTGFDLRSTSLFMHNMYREGKVDRELIKTPETNKNTVYLYTNTER